MALADLSGNIGPELLSVEPYLGNALGMVGIIKKTHCICLMVLFLRSKHRNEAESMAGHKCLIALSSRA